MIVDRHFNYAHNYNLAFVMGIAGLKSLLDNNPQLFQTHRLHDCPLVIDGNNIFHHIYLESDFDGVMGGEYDAYYARTVEFFERLRRCNVVPYVVIDGSHTEDANVLPYVIKRAKDNLSRVVALSRGNGSYGSLPLHGCSVFMDVMRDLGVAFVRSDYSADSQVAALANQLGSACPVLSGDSDFYVYDIKGGFINWNSLSTEIQKKKKTKTQEATLMKPYRYLTASIYFLDGFLKGFAEGIVLNRTTFKLFATLSHYQLMQGLSLHPLDVMIRQRNAENGLKLKCKLTMHSARHRHMAEFLFGLRSVTRSEAIEAVIAHLGAKDRFEAKKSLQAMMEEYSPNLTLAPELLGLENTTVARSPLTFTSSTGEPLPPWFLHRHRACEQHGHLLQVVQLRWVTLVTCVENFNSESANDASIQLRRIIYGILLGSRGSVKEIGRRREFVHTEEVFTLSKLPNDKDIPRLEHLPTLTPDAKRKFLAEVLIGSRFNLADNAAADSLKTDVPEEWLLFVWTLVFWMRAARKPPTLSRRAGDHGLGFWHLDSLLLSGIYYKALQNHFKIDAVRDAASSLKKDVVEQEKGNKEQPPSTLKDTFLLVSSMSSKTRRDHVKSSMSDFLKSPVFGRFTSPDLDVIHPFAQFQSCLYYSVQLNQLLDNPVPEIRVSEFLNFVFIYNVCCHLKDHWEARDELFATWLGLIDDSSTNPIHAIFRDLHNLIVRVTTDVDGRKDKETVKGEPSWRRSSQCI